MKKVTIKYDDVFEDYSAKFEYNGASWSMVLDLEKFVSECLINGVEIKFIIN